MQLICRFQNAKFNKPKYERCEVLIMIKKLHKKIQLLTKNYWYDIFLIT